MIYMSEKIIIMMAITTTLRHVIKDGERTVLASCCGSTQTPKGELGASC